MKEQEHRESEAASKEPKRFPMDQLRKETGQEATEEYAAEITAPYAAPKQAPVEARRTEVSNEVDEPEARSSAGVASWIGYTSILLSVISLFIYPVLFGAAGSLLGLLAYSQGQKALGVWSVILGLVSLAGYFLLVPLYS